MIDLNAAFTALRMDIVKLANLEHERLDLLSSPLHPAMKDEREEGLRKDIERQRSLVLRVLADVIAFPPQHRRHEQELDKFHAVAPFEKSVFIMTKFPDKKNPAPIDAELTAVIQAVQDAVKECGFVPRIATDNHYYPMLWDNVELYLLGCSRGIAIVEDKYLPELNPNVSMEWGWMRGMGRSVLYLVEKDFANERADWSGLIESPFDWAAPSPDIKTAVEKWLRNPGG